MLTSIMATSASRQCISRDLFLLIFSQDITVPTEETLYTITEDHALAHWHIVITYNPLLCGIQITWMKNFNTESKSQIHEP